MAEMVITLSGDEAKLFRAQQKIIQQQLEIEKGYGKVAKSSKDASTKAKEQASSTASEFSALDQVFSSAVTGIVGMATAYASIDVAVGLVTGAIDAQIELQKESLDLAKQLAAEQQEAAKNLTGVSSPEIQRVLAAEVPRIATEQGFSDLKQITNAIGAGYSASGDLARTLSAVESAAQLTRLTPQQLPTVAAGALDVARGSGLNDARANLGFLLSAGKAARIEDPAKLAGTLAPVVSSGVATVPTQEKTEAATQIAAVFTALNQQATDKSGDSTRTATTLYLAKLEQLFAEKGNDPGTVFGRIEAIQKTPELKEEFFAKPFGEVAFQKAFQLLGDSSSDLSKAMGQASSEITFSTDTFAAKSRELETATPQIQIASAAERAKASAVVSKSGDVEGASAEQIRELTAQALKDTAGPILGSTLTNLFLATQRYAQSGTFTENQANLAFDQLRRRGIALASAPESAFSSPSQRTGMLEEVQAAMQAVRTLYEVKPTQFVIPNGNEAGASGRTISTTGVIGGPGVSTSTAIASSTVTDASMAIADQTQSLAAADIASQNTATAQSDPQLLAEMKRQNDLLEQQNSMLEKQHAENLGAKNTDRSTTKAAIQSANAQTAAKGIGAL